MSIPKFSQHLASFCAQYIPCYTPCNIGHHQMYRYSNMFDDTRAVEIGFKAKF